MCLCCTTLRGVTYFMVNVHMLGSFALFVMTLHSYLFQPFEVPPGLEDVNPLFLQKFPLIVCGYALIAALFSCFIYRAVDMESLFQLTWSVVSFGGFQFLVIFLHLVFTIMFKDIIASNWQVAMICLLVANFSATIIYLTTLFLYGKKIHYFKYGQNIRNSIGNNLPASQMSSSVFKKQSNQHGRRGTSDDGSSTNPNPDLNLLENHPPVSRTNSVCKSTCTNDDLDILEAQPPPDGDEFHRPPSPPPLHEHSPPPSYQSSPDV